MGYVYLIGEIGNEGRYKIGSTRAKDVNKRLKQLQTGNSSELYIKESFETEYPFKIEKMLHNHFKSSNLMGEWFELSESDVEAFKGVCEEKKKVVESLKDNPFYFPMKLVPMSEMKLRDYGDEDEQEITKQLVEDFNNRFKAYREMKKSDGT